MHSSIKDYKKIYRLQDKFLHWWSDQDFPFYLTGGTALGRFFLNHRYSEDLDFFVNGDPLYPEYIDSLKPKLTNYFLIDDTQTLYSDGYTRFFIREAEDFLKLEFVNEVQYRSGSPFNAPFGQIDSPLNILSNKLTAILGRDEPKDVFDIVSIAENYSFQWMEVFFEAKKKAVINEIDLEERLVTFPIELIEQSDWLSAQSGIERFSRCLKTVSNDFLMGRENSLGTGKKNIKNATPDFSDYR